MGRLRPGVPRVRVLAAALFAATGRRVRRLSRFSRGAQSANFAGEWADGGSRFVLKLVPFAREAQYARLVNHLESAVRGLAVRELSGRIRFDVGRWHALLLEWMEGDILTLDSLSKVGDMARFISAYGAFSSSIQGAGALYPTCDYPAMLSRVRASPLAALLPASLNARAFAPLRGGMRVIHGDFQPDNLRFTGGELTGVMDLEELRLGSPVEDLARYAMTSAERLPFFAFRRRRALAAALGALVAASPFSAMEWAAALHAFALEKLLKNLRKRRVSPLRRLNLRWRVAFCERLVGVAVRAAAHNGAITP